MKTRDIQHLERLEKQLLERDMLPPAGIEEHAWLRQVSLAQYSLA